MEQNLIEKLQENKILKLTDSQYLLCTPDTFLLIDNTNDDQKFIGSIDLDLVTYNEECRTLFMNDIPSTYVKRRYKQ